MRYPTMEQTEKELNEKYGHLKEGWNENPTNAMKYDSLQSAETKVAIEKQEAAEYSLRAERVNNGEAPISHTMYPTMKFKEPETTGEKIDRSSLWVQTHGSIEGFKEYMDGLKHGLDLS